MNFIKSSLQFLSPIEYKEKTMNMFNECKDEIYYNDIHLKTSEIKEKINNINTRINIANEKLNKIDENIKNITIQEKYEMLNSINECKDEIKLIEKEWRNKFRELTNIINDLCDRQYEFNEKLNEKMNNLENRNKTFSFKKFLLYILNLLRLNKRIKYLK